MSRLHRNNVWGSRDVVKHALDLDSRENMEMINNEHEREIKKIENEDYINRMNANARNKREDEDSRARQQERMVKLKGELEYNSRKLEGEISHQMEELNIQRMNDSNMHAREIKKIGNSQEQALRRIEIESKKEDHDHEQAKSKINNEFQLGMEDRRLQSKRDDHEFQKDLRKIEIERLNAINKGKCEFAQINNTHEEKMTAIRGKLKQQNNQFKLKCKEIDSNLQSKKNEYDYNLNMEKEKNKKDEYNYNLTMKDKEKDLEIIKGNFKIQEETIKSKHKEKYLEEKLNGKKEMQKIKGAHQEKLGELKACKTIKDLLTLKIIKNAEKNGEDLEKKMKFLEANNMLETKEENLPPNYNNPQLSQSYMFSQLMITPGYPMYNNFNQQPIYPQGIPMYGQQMFHQGNQMFFNQQQGYPQPMYPPQSQNVPYYNYNQ